MIKHAHFYWGNTEFPWLHSLSVRSFVAHHPGWRVTLWRPPADRRCTYPLTASVPFESLGCEIAVVDPQDKTGAMLLGYETNNAWLQTAWSDALRLWCLHEYGGLYSDCDVLWFRPVEGSSLDGPGLRLLWDGGIGLYNSLIAAGERENPTLGKLLRRIREMSPVEQVPGGDTPYGSHLWARAAAGEPFAKMDRAEFHAEPFSVAMHYRAARILWASTGPENWRAKVLDAPDMPGLAAAVARTLELLGS